LTGKDTVYIINRKEKNHKKVYAFVHSYKIFGFFKPFLTQKPPKIRKIGNFFVQSTQKWLFQNLKVFGN